MGLWSLLNHCAYFFVHSWASLQYFSRSVLYTRANSLVWKYAMLAYQLQVLGRRLGSDQWGVSKLIVEFFWQSAWVTNLIWSRLKCLVAIILPQKIKAINASIRVDIWMIDSGYEADFWWFERIVRREVYVQIKRTTLGQKVTPNSYIPFSLDTVSRVVPWFLPASEKGRCQLDQRSTSLFF